MINVNDTQDFLDHLRRLRIQVWAEGNRLRFRAPRGAVSDALREQISSRRGELLSALKRRPKRDSAPGLIPALPRNGSSLPLSFAQERLWLIDRIEGGSRAYNEFLAFGIRGELDACAVEASLRAVAQRHEALRVSFREELNAPRLAIAPLAAFGLRRLDLRGLARGRQEPELRRLAFQESRRLFHLDRGPLLRALLIHNEPLRHTLFLTLHHIICDGLSNSILARDFVAYYRQATEGITAVLPPLRVQYADFAQWQRELLSGPLLHRTVDFWRTTLGDAPSLVQLPSDRPRPAARSIQGGRVLFSLPSELSSRLKSFSRSHRCTLFAPLFAIYACLLARCDGRRDVVIGTPATSRSRTELELLIGLFVNMLPLRMDLRGRPGFRQAMSQATSVLQEALAHQELPFEKVVEALNPERSSDHSPIFQCVFTLRNKAEVTILLPGLELERLDLHGSLSKFDLTLSMGDSDQGIEGSLEYSVDIFDQSTVQRMARLMQRLTRAALDQPDLPFDDLPWLDGPERRELLSWGRPTGPWSLPEGALASVHRLFEDQARMRPQSPALVSNGTQVDYGSLNRRSNRLARLLRSRGAASGSAIGICMERSCQLIVAMLAALKAGAAYVPLDPSYPPERLERMLEDCRADLVLIQDGLEWKGSSGASTVLPIGSAESEAQASSSRDLEIATWPSALAYVMFTSGSTGRPKGVEVTHEGVVRLVRETSYALFGENQASLLHSSISFDGSTFEIWAALLHGARLVIAPPGPLSLAQLGETIRRQGVTSLFLTTGLFHLMADGWLSGLDSLAQMIAGGDALSPQKAQRALEELPGTSVINGYGPTESTTFSACFTVRPADCRRQRLPIGRPIAGTVIRLLDERLRPVPQGVPGEILIGGEGLARGYSRRPGLTAQRFIPDPLDPSPGSRLYRSGDLGRWLSDGSIEFLGRRDRQVKIRGFRIEPGEIETALERHSSVAQAAIAPIRGSALSGGPSDRYLAAYVVPQAGQSVKAGDLMAHLSSRLPAHMLPAALVVLESFPLTSNGKLDRKALPSPALKHFEAAGAPPDESADAVAPSWRRRASGPVEEILASLWKKALGLSEIDAGSNLFALGGHSLTATRLASEISRLFEIEMPVRSFFESPTLLGIARRIEVLRRRGEARRRPALRRHDRGESDPAPLSFAQQRLWFLNRLEGPSATYNVAAAIRLEGTLRADLLERCLREVARRHEALRTVFPARRQEAIQEVLPLAERLLEIVDLSSLDPAQSVFETQRQARLHASRPFDLARGPLLRLTLLIRGPSDGALLINLAHIVADGWSIGVLVEELTALYEAFSAGRPSPLPELPLQYSDFARWQRAWLQGQALREQSAFWIEHLRGAPEILQLPWDRPRPAKVSFRGGTVEVDLDPDLVQRLRLLSQRSDSTLFMVLLAGFAGLLSRYSGQDDLVIGAPIANRNEAELEPLIGFFVNTLPLRIRLADRPGAQDLIERVRRTCLEAYAHQDLPFEQLVEMLQPQRSLSRTPVFQVMLAHQNAPLAPLRIPGLSCTPLEIEQNLSKFDLTLQVHDYSGGLSAHLEYSSDLFDRSTAQRMSSHLARLLSAMCHQPHRALAELDFLSPQERSWLLSCTAEPLLPGSPTEPVLEWREEAHSKGAIHQRFEQWAQRTPESTALIEIEDAAGAVEGGVRRVAYRELNLRANRLARRLVGMGIELEDRVAICLPRTADLAVAALASLKAGGAYVPFDPQHPRQRLRDRIADCEAQVLVTTDRLAERLSVEDLATIRLDCDGPSIAQEDGSDLQRPGGLERLAYAIYTSGSTGVPKGVLISHGNVCRLIEGTQRRFEFTQRDVWALSHSAAFDFSVWEMWGALLNGGRLIVVPHGVSRSPQEMRQLIDRLGVTVLNQTPSAFRQLQESIEGEGESGNPAPPFPTLRWVIFGGEALDPAGLADWFARKGDDRPQLVNMYGITETTVHVTWRRMSQADVRDARSRIGVPVPDWRMYLLDSEMQPAAIGVPGEIYVGGVGLARAYHRQPALTASRFLPDPFNSGAARSGERMYRSGDRARRLPDGDVEYLGRLDGQVKIRGFRIELGEIESVLDACSGVRKSAVVVRSGGSAEKRLLACYQPQGEADESDAAASLRRQLKRQLPEYMIPAEFVKVDSLPLTANGKIDRRALSQLSAGPTASAAKRRPLSALEEILLGIWRELLDGRQVDADESLFDQGAHSLLVTQAVGRVRESLDVELSVRSVFEHPTIASQASQVAELRRADAPRPPRLKASARQEQEPLSYSQQRMWFLDKIEGAQAAYNVPFGLRIESPPDRASTAGIRFPALATALDEIVRRHEALRTRFPEVSGKPIQEIDDAGSMALPLVDLSGLAVGLKSDEAERIRTSQARLKFDLARGPVIRALVILEEPPATAGPAVLPCPLQLFINMHHIVSDAWSIDVLMRELSSLYKAFEQGTHSPLPELPVQFRDYSRWQREWLKGGALRAGMAFWKGLLTPLPAPLQLPLDRPRPALQSFRGGMWGFRIESQDVQRAKTLASRSGSTLFMTFLAAYACLLFRHSRQRDLVIGSPIANRSRRETEGLIGFFTNSLPLRLRLPKRTRFASLLKQVRTTCLHAFENQEIPFETVVDELQPDRDLSRTPLFQTLFSLRNSAVPPPDLGGLAIRSQDVGTGTSKFDLSLFLEESPQGLNAGFEFNADLFESCTVERMARRFERLLASVCADPDSRLEEIDLLDPKERSELNRLSAAQEQRGDDWEDARDVLDLFRDQVRERSAQAAVLFSGESVSYSRLDRRSDWIARRLQEEGVGRGSLVGICLPRNPDLVAAVLAVLKVGACCLPLDPDYPARRLEFMLSDARPDCLVAFRQAPSALLEADPPGVFLAWEEGEDEAVGSERPIDATPAEGSPAYAIYTSGSTGIPKGAQVARRTLSNLIAWQLRQTPRPARTLQFAALSFDVSFQEILSTLCQGGTLILVANETRRDPRGLLGLIAQEGIERLFLPFVALAQLARTAAESADDRVRPVREVITAGEALQISQGLIEGLKRLGGEGGLPRLINHYGPSETHVVTSHELGGEPAAWPALPPIGRPLTGVEVRILDGDFQPAPMGVPGELCLGGPVLAWGGYRGRAALTAERFVPDPLSAEPNQGGVRPLGGGGRRLYRTGDLARFGCDGEIEFLGRIDHQVKIRGYRVEVGEIEALLSQCPGVREAAVAMRGRGNDRSLVGYATAAGQPPSRSQLREYLKARLPEFMLPDSILLLDQLPMTPSGKVDRKRLPEPTRARPELESKMVLPRNPAEEQIARLWRDVLELDELGVHDHFFEIGGNSMKAARLLSLLNEAFPDAFSISDLFDRTNVAEQAELIKDAQVRPKRARRVRF